MRERKEEKDGYGEREILIEKVDTDSQKAINSENENEKDIERYKG